MSPAHHLLGIFTRYPEPGRTKTRMIPRLGAEGAARLQEAMTGHTLLRARVWAATRNARLCVHFTGATKRRFQKWLGPDLPYTAQAGPDLGARMAHAIDSGLQGGEDRVVLIGCDCPDLSDEQLDAAMAALDDHDVVLGPATDGGYYLIGMKRVQPALFKDMAWGGPDVLSHTRLRAAENRLRLAELPPLQDVDEPGELPIWERHDPNQHGDGISVIIPARNEEQHIAAAVRSALGGAREVIVIDADSSDGTREAALAAGARILTAPAGRAIQMNIGASSAKGRHLLFLHADSRVPEHYATHASAILARKDTAAGAFSLAIDAEGRRFRAVEWGVRQRVRLFALPYGDQALFMTRDTFTRVGGYAQMPLMEDLDLMRRLKRRGRIVIAAEPILTSSRRWRRLGVARSVARNQLILLAAACGVTTERLARWYNTKDPDFMRIR